MGLPRVAISRSRQKEAITLNLSTLTKTVKGYALNASASNEALLNNLLRPYAEAARVNSRDGEEFRLNKSQVSRLMNGRMDVLNGLRAALGRYGLEDEISTLFEDVLGEFIDLSRFKYLADETTGLCAESQYETRLRLESACANPAQFMSIALMEAVKAPNVSVLQRELFSRGARTIWVEVGDLLDRGFGKRRRNAPKPIVVIPVDTGFRTHVTRAYEDVDHPAVADTTLHGQWLTRMMQSDKGLSETLLSQRIDDSLRLHATSDLNGELPHKIGTIAVIEADCAVFYLLAISTFDGNNNAHATPDDVRTAVKSLLSFYDRNGQGHDLYVPLMGTGLSRAGMSARDAYEMLADELCSSSAFFAGKVTITVLADAATEIGLMDSGD